MDVMAKAANDIKYLLDRGYPQHGAICYVCDHYRLDINVRYILTRVIISGDTVISRRAKTLRCENIKGTQVWIDGYNILIGVESGLKGEPVYLCDDGFLRDTRGVFRNYHCSTITQKALDKIISVLAGFKPFEVEILFDSQISKSGELARWTGQKLVRADINGCVRTSRHVDYDLKHCGKIIATSDGSIIDAVESVINLQKKVFEQLGITPITIER